tara:strand:- start:221 stop:613 length:393 start_codon:yes stop_codon:yes gene_type:complete
MTRKHIGIYQSGPKKGLLKKGFYYSGGKTKTGLSIIKKTKKGGGRNCNGLSNIRDTSYRYKNVMGSWPTGFHPCTSCECSGITPEKVKDCTTCAEELYKLYKKGLSTRKELGKAISKAERVKSIFKKHNQ